MAVRVRRIHFFGCSGATAALVGIRWPANAAEFTYKLALIVPSTDQAGIHTLEAVSRIYRDSGGRLEIKVFPNSQLGADPQALSQTRLGAIEFFSASDPTMSSVVPALGMTGLPFVASSEKVAANLLGGGFGSYVRAAVEKLNLYQLPGGWGSGFRQIENSVRPIITPTDMQGLKIRSSGSPETAAMKALGANPTPLPPSEIYTSLQTHLIDAAQVVLSGVESFKLYEVTKYISIVNFIWGELTMVANTDAWARLPRNLQEIVERNFAIGRDANNTDIPRYAEATKSRLKFQGMLVNNADIPSFRKTIRDSGLYSQWRAQYGAELWTLLERQVGALG